MSSYISVVKRSCYTRQFFLQLATQRHCETSCRRNCACNTPSLQLVSQRKIARRVAGKVEQSTFRNVAWSVAACNIYLATCVAILEEGANQNSDSLREGRGGKGRRNSHRNPRWRRCLRFAKARKTKKTAALLAQNIKIKTKVGSSRT